jgi:hypothetical protein
VIESGTSDAEVIQSKVTDDGRTFDTLKDRLDSNDSKLVENTQEIGIKDSLPSWLQESLRDVTKCMMTI